MDADSDISLGNLIAWLGAPASLVVLAGLFAVGILLVRGLRARRRGLGTADIHWWLGAVIRTLLLAAVVLYTLRLISHFNEMVSWVEDSKSSSGAADFLVAAAFRSLIVLLFPCAVALLGTIAALVLGPPREPASDRTASDGDSTDR